MFKEFLFNVTALATVVGVFYGTVTLYNKHSDNVLKSNPASFEATGVDINLDMIQPIVCMHGRTQVGYGTSFYIGDGKFISAAHVINRKMGDDSCFLYGKIPLALDKIDEKHDLMQLRFVQEMKVNQQGFKISCKAFRPNKMYLSIGFSNGETFTLNKLIATNRKTPAGYTIDGHSMPGINILKGRLNHGMSGGPVLDTNSQVVGINTATDGNGTIAMSYALKDTFLCKK